MPKTIAPRRPSRSKADADVPALEATPIAAPPFAPVARIARELRNWTDTVLGVAGGAADMSLALAKSRVTDPKKKAAIEKAGALLRGARKAAGVTMQELSAAIDLSDPKLLEEAERGRAALPFEVVLRLAAVLGRKDPLTFALDLTRAYSPQLWKAMQDLGVGKLVVQAGRERELANIYRGHDAARTLSDADFAEVLEFTAAAFAMAVAFRASAPARKPS